MSKVSIKQEPKVSIKQESKPFEIISFSKFKNVVSLDPSSGGARNPYEVLSRILDYSLYPLYGFDPVEDVKKISHVTQKRGKNQEQRRKNQIDSLKEMDLKSQTIYQCFESVGHCFIYDQSIQFPDSVSYLHIDDGTIEQMLTILRSDSGRGKPFSMPGFLACAAAFQKIEKNPLFHYGAMLKRLTFHHSIPIIDKPVGNYLKNFYQTLILFKLISKIINVNAMIDYFLTWESNAPTVLDYRCFLISKTPELRKNMQQHFETSLADYDDHHLSGLDDMMINIFRDFVVVPKMLYKGESHVGFQSARWFAPLEVSTFFGGLDIVHFDTPIIRESMEPSLTRPIVEKSHIKPHIEGDTTDQIHFSPPFDFNEQHVEINISDKISKTPTDLSITEQIAFLRTRKEIIKKMQAYRKLSTVPKSKSPFFNDSFLLCYNNFFSSDISGTVRLSDEIKSELNMLHGEMLHQWARDMTYLKMILIYLRQADVESKDFAFVHEKIFKPALTNEFDHIHLNQEQNFATFFPDSVLPIKRGHSKLPLTLDDIMYLYFLLLDQIHSNIAMKTFFNPDLLVIKMIQKMKPTTVIRWLVLWLSLHNIPYQSGYSEQTSRNNVFNSQILPILYKWKILPMKKSERLKFTSFEKNPGFDSDYTWHALEITLRDADFYVHQQTTLARLLIYRHIFNALLPDNKILSNDFDPKRFFAFDTTHDDITQIVYQSRDYLPPNSDLQEILDRLSFISMNKIPITDILLIIDFFNACMNQYGSYLSFLIPKGNQFYKIEKKYTVLSGMKKKSGADHHALLQTSSQTLEDFPDDDLGFYIEDIFNPPSIADIPRPYWIFADNPHLEQLDISLKELKSALNNQIQPNPYFIEIQTHSIQFYPKDQNVLIRNDGLPFLDMIIENLKYMINNDYEIEHPQAKIRKHQINNHFRSFLDIYFTPLGIPYAWDKHTVQYFERVKIRDLRDMDSRKKRMYRFIFLREFVKNQTEIVKEFYNILEMMRFDTVVQDNGNIADRLQHALYTVNNFINRELPISIFREHEVLERTITLEEVTGTNFRYYLLERNTIISLRNFRYLFKSLISGDEKRFFPNFPTVQVEWKIFIKDDHGINTPTKIHKSQIKVDPYDFTLEESRSYKIYYPPFDEAEIHYLAETRNCTIYSELNLVLQKADLSDFTRNQDSMSRIVVYHPLSLPGAKVSVFGQDTLGVVAGNLFERIQRFNNFTYLNQPDRLLFLHANITQSII